MQYLSKKQLLGITLNLTGKNLRFFVKAFAGSNVG
jgi:hypothetical protein